MKIKFLGAAGTVTGSCYVLSSGKTSVMVDFGMFQGKPENEGWNSIQPDLDMSRLTAVAVTHAHLDHCGRLPLLAKGNFKGSIYMTAATEALVEIVLMDAAKLAKEEAKSVIYDELDVETVLSMIKIVKYDQDVNVGDFKIRFLDSGHILGSSTIQIEEKETSRKVVFSGDLGNSPEPIIAPTEWVGEAEIVVMEATYGDRLHDQRNEMDIFAEIIAKAERTSGVVLVPSFSIERAQEILYLFDQLKKKGKMKEKTPVYLDSPMAIKATMVFKQFPNLYSKKLKAQVKTDDPFDFPGLVLCDKVEKSKAIRRQPGVKVIVAGSGMMSGGRIIHHAADYLGDPKTQLVFVGFQAEGTMGREIKEGANRINVYGREVEIRAQIINISSMSAHADQTQLLNWIKKIWGLKTVFLTHGEELPRLVLAEKIRQETEGVKVEIPIINQEIELKK